MNVERRRSSLLSELGRAQNKIASLEEFIRDRERQFHTAVVRLERQDSLRGASMRERRPGLSQDMLRTRNLSCEEREEIPGKDVNIKQFCNMTFYVLSRSDILQMRSFPNP